MYLHPSLAFQQDLGPMMWAWDGTGFLRWVQQKGSIINQAKWKGRLDLEIELIRRLHLWEKIGVLSSLSCLLTPHIHDTASDLQLGYWDGVQEMESIINQAKWMGRLDLVMKLVTRLDYWEKIGVFWSLSGLSTPHSHETISIIRSCWNPYSSSIYWRTYPVVMDDNSKGSYQIQNLSSLPPFP